MTVGWTGSTATAGAKSGTVTINNTDLTTAGTGQGSADGDDTVTVSGNVYDHANASFASPSDTNSTTVNVGIYKTGSGTQTAGFNIYNLVNTASFTAGLQYLSQSGSGNTAQLTSNIASAFTGVLAAGSNIALQANLGHRLRREFLRRLHADPWRRRQHHRPHQPKRHAQSLRPRAQQWHDLLDRRRRLRLGSEPHQNQLDRSIVHATSILQGDTVVFNDAQNPSGSRAVTLNTSVSPASVTFDHSTGANYTISGSGAIGGTGGVTKTGSAPVTLSTNNTYTGGTTVDRRHADRRPCKRPGHRRPDDQQHGHWPSCKPVCPARCNCPA